MPEFKIEEQTETVTLCTSPAAAAEVQRAPFASLVCQQM
jgi:hypothetical protein